MESVPAGSVHLNFSLRFVAPEWNKISYKQISKSIVTAALSKVVVEMTAFRLSWKDGTRVWVNAARIMGIGTIFLGCAD